MTKLQNPFFPCLYPEPKRVCSRGTILDFWDKNFLAIWISFSSIIDLFQWILWWLELIGRRFGAIFVEETPSKEMRCHVYLYYIWTIDLCCSFLSKSHLVTHNYLLIIAERLERTCSVFNWGAKMKLHHNLIRIVRRTIPNSRSKALLRSCWEGLRVLVRSPANLNLARTKLLTSLPRNPCYTPWRIRWLCHN